MGWATSYIQRLQQGETVQFRPLGKSMSGRIESGQLCTVAPIGNDELKRGDVVLCKVRGCQYLHLVKAVRAHQYLIGNNRGRDNGWVGRNGVYGKCVRVED
jgi:hypothetical protein